MMLECTTNAGTLIHYTLAHWQCWNLGSLYPLEMLESWSITPTGNVGTLVHYTHWKCWNPGPLHPLEMLESWSITPTGMLEPWSITSTGKVGTLVHYTHWNPGPLHQLEMSVHYIHWKCWNHYNHWKCWDPGPLHPLEILETWSNIPIGNAGTLVHYIHWNSGPLAVPIGNPGTLTPLEILTPYIYYSAALIRILVGMVEPWHTGNAMPGPTPISTCNACTCRSMLAIQQPIKRW